MNPEQPQEGGMQRRIRASVAMVMHYSDQMKRSMTVRVVRYLFVVAVILAALLLGKLLGAL